MAGARLLMLITVVIWGWTFVATKVALVYVTPVELLGLRLLVALPVLAVLCLVRRPDGRLPPRAWGRAAPGAALFTAHFLVQITALRTATATNTSWIITLVPLILAALSWLLLGERAGARLAVGIAVATAGVLLLVSRGRLDNLDWLRSTGDWLALLSAFTWAAYTIATRDLARARDPLIVALAMILPAAAVTLGWMAFRSDWARLASLPPSAIVALLFLGVLGTALAQWFWQVGVARLGASRAGVFLYVEPLATTALAVPLLGEPFGAASASGAALVLLGVWYAQREPQGRTAA
jgi:drug/metabolite transporter (DMT)-like permease